MISVKLNGEEYFLPSGWEEVTIGQWEKIMELNGILNEYKSILEYTLDMFSILMNADKNDLKKMTRESFEELSKYIEWVKKKPNKTGKREFIIGDEKWVAVNNLNSLTMGDSVSLELMISSSSETNILINILPILIRKAKLTNKGGKDVVVPGDFNADEYEEIKELFKNNLYVSDVLEFADFFSNTEI